MAVTVALNGTVATVTINNPPVNAIALPVRQGLLAALAQTETDPAIHAVVLICAGRTFVAGADIGEFGQPPVAPHLPDVIRAIEAAQKPWVAAIHGNALGGGLELTLACAYRIATRDAKLGLPEVTLGLIPGAGGTVRLPRLIGAEAALDMIAGGKPVTAARAQETGLIDGIIDDDLHREAQEFTSQISSGPHPKPLLQRHPQMPADADAWAAQIARITARARGQSAPIAVIKAVENALNLPADQALAAERQAFLTLKNGAQSKALRHIFFAERRAGRIEAAKDVPSRPLSAIGIIGGGTMGAGIAAACLLAGLGVTLIERDEAALQQGRDRVGQILADSLRRGLIPAEARARMWAAFTGATDYAALGAADLVIEAVFEDMAVKRAVFEALDAATKADCILASNTSYLDINALAAGSRDPSRVLGLHFFSPAHIMKLLELVVTDSAAPAVLATGLALGRRLGKITVPAGVCDGFIGNRIMSAYRRECDAMLEDGALPWGIDAAMRDYGFAMGIFEMQDLAGLDIAWAMRKRQAAARDPAARYVDIADRLCEAGRFGRKTGRGWYIHDGKTALPDPEVEALIMAESARKGIARQRFSAARVVDSILAVMAATGQQILAEGIARNADDIDVVMVNGYGFPRWKGGPMYQAACAATGAAASATSGG